MSVFKAQSLLGNQYVRVYNASTHETLRIEGAAYEFRDDFDQSVIQTTAAGVKGWTVKDTGAATEALVANQGCGVVSLNLTNANEKQEAGLYLADALNFNLDKHVIFEARVAVHTTPVNQAELYFGLANAYVEGPIIEADAGPTIHALFAVDAGALTSTIHTDDTVNETAAGGVATGHTYVLDTYYVFRIDVTDPAKVKFYINGARKAPTTTFNMSQGANVVVQPFFMAHKEADGAGTGAGSLYIDYVKVWQLER